MASSHNLTSEGLNPTIAIRDRLRVVAGELAQNDIGRECTLVSITDSWQYMRTGQHGPSLVPYCVKFDDDSTHWFIRNRLEEVCL